MVIGFSINPTPQTPSLLFRTKKKKTFCGKPRTAPCDSQHRDDPFEPCDISERAGWRRVRGCCWATLTLMFVPHSSWLSASIESRKKTPLSMKNNPSLLAGLRCTCYNNRICKELWADLIAYHVSRMLSQFRSEFYSVRFKLST